MKIFDLKNLKVMEPLSLHCTMHVGGKAKYYIEPKNEKELIDVIKFCSSKKMKFYIIGNGSNVIFKDSGFSGVIICTKKLNIIKCKNNIVMASSGVNLFVLNKYLIDSSLSGMEFSYGIPGTVGGAVCMNAGAYGSEMSGVVLKVKVFDGKKTKILKNNQLGFGYRDSIFRHNSFVVLKVWLLLQKGEQKDIKNLCQKYFLKRKATQPLEFSNSGSIFKKNGETSSGKLIDNLGLKGAKINSAEVSILHANFIVNTGNATSQDIETLIDLIKQKVLQNYNIKLEQEVIFVGD